MAHPVSGEMLHTKKFNKSIKRTIKEQRREGMAPIVLLTDSHTFAQAEYGNTKRATSTAECVKGAVSEE